MTRLFENVDVALPALASGMMENGAEVGSRLGERTVEVLHQQTILEEPWKREVLVDGRGANVVAQIAETMWVLAGRNDVEWLSHYLPRAKDFSDDGEVWRGGYGPRLRFWHDHHSDNVIDQIKHVVDVLHKDRTSRRAVASIYDPVLDTTPGKDIPCNDFLSFINRNGRLDLSVFVRSNDLIWGWSGINQFEWSALQEIVAGLLGVEVGCLIFNTTSLHIYDRHWEKARRLTPSPLAYGYADSPRFNPRERDLEYVDGLIQAWFRVEEKLRMGRAFHADEVMHFPEPMMRSWLMVLAWYWTGDEEYTDILQGTRLWAAVQMSPASVRRHAGDQKRPKSELGIVKTADPFIDAVDNLHREKSAAYGDSWKKRGEQMSILANIARKVDRLEGGVETSDETQADTVVDLLVYLVKYRLWLSETNPNLSLPTMLWITEDDNVRALLEWLSTVVTGPIGPERMSRALDAIQNKFSDLEHAVTKDPSRADDSPRASIVADLLLSAYVVAHSRWDATQVDYQNPYRNIDA